MHRSYRRRSAAQFNTTWSSRSRLSFTGSGTRNRPSRLTAKSSAPRTSRIRRGASYRGVGPDVTSTAMSWPSVDRKKSSRPSLRQRLRASRGRNLPSPFRRWKGAHIDLLGIGLVRHVGDPSTVGRRAALRFVGRRLLERLRLAVAHGWTQPQVHPGFRRSGRLDQETVVERPVGEVLGLRRSEELFLHLAGIYDDGAHAAGVAAA